MQKRERGGMIEFIPTPKEKRQDMVDRHVFDLLENVHQGMRRLEGEHNPGAQGFEMLQHRIRAEEQRVQDAYG